jgi:hypothetical protein
MTPWRTPRIGLPVGNGRRAGRCRPTSPRCSLPAAASSAGATAGRPPRRDHARIPPRVRACPAGTVDRHGPGPDARVPAARCRRGAAGVGQRAGSWPGLAGPVIPWRLMSGRAARAWGAYKPGRGRPGGVRAGRTTAHSTQSAEKTACPLGRRRKPTGGYGSAPPVETGGALSWDGSGPACGGCYYTSGCHHGRPRSRVLSHHRRLDTREVLAGDIDQDNRNDQCDEHDAG